MEIRREAEIYYVGKHDFARHAFPATEFTNLFFGKDFFLWKDFYLNGSPPGSRKNLSQVKIFFPDTLYELKCNYILGEGRLFRKQAFWRRPAGALDFLPCRDLDFNPA